MVVNPNAVQFPDNDPTVMLAHLDRWATDTVTSVEAWATLVERCGQWADYTPRNQVLLASYGIATAVAGPATWAQIPSTEPGRPCAVRTGEHGLPVRVPLGFAVGKSFSNS